MKYNQVTSIAPGRINIIGEHTDYNDGLVMPAAIQKQIKTIIRKENSSICKIHALDLGQYFEFDIQSFKRIEKGWQNYVMGVVSEIMKLGGDIGGFTCEIQGDVPLGGGMSSSAALECSLAVALNELFNLRFEKIELIKACHRAEHNFVLIRSGIMDQFASIMGKKDHVLLLDCLSLEMRYAPLQIADYDILVLNTNVAHELASSEYNNRRAQCEEGVAMIKKRYPNVRSLRDVTMEMLTFCQTQMEDTIFRRCRHVIMENSRVIKAAFALEKGDIEALGSLMYTSHMSLKEDYHVSCDELDFLVDQTRNKSFIKGSRMMGGGFGGSTINLISKASTKTFIEQISEAYQGQFGIDITPTIVSIEDGARVIDKS